MKFKYFFKAFTEINFVDMMNIEIVILLKPVHPRSFRCAQFLVGFAAIFLISYTILFSKFQ